MHLVRVHLFHRGIATRHYFWCHRSELLTSTVFSPARTQINANLHVHSLKHAHPTQRICGHLSRLSQRVMFRQRTGRLFAREVTGREQARWHVREMFTVDGDELALCGCGSDQRPSTSQAYTIRHSRPNRPDRSRCAPSFRRRALLRAGPSICPALR